MFNPSPFHTPNLPDIRLALLPYMSRASIMKLNLLQKVNPSTDYFSFGYSRYVRCMYVRSDRRKQHRLTLY